LEELPRLAILQNLAS